MFIKPIFWSSPLMMEWNIHSALQKLFIMMVHFCSHHLLYHHSICAKLKAQWNDGKCANWHTDILYFNGTQIILDGIVKVFDYIRNESKYFVTIRVRFRTEWMRIEAVHQHYGCHELCGHEIYFYSNGSINGPIQNENKLEQIAGPAHKIKTVFRF